MKAYSWLIVVGLVILAALSLPGGMILGIPTRFFPPLFDDSLSSQFLLILPVALIAAAALIYLGLTQPDKSKELDLRLSSVQPKRSRWLSLVALILSVLILARTVLIIYWLIVWDSTDDPLGTAWLLFPSLMVLGCSLFLIASLPGKSKAVGFAFLLLLPTVFFTGKSALHVDFRQLTEARAEKISQAIEAYHEGEGRYPDNLRQLFPRYAVLIPSPVLIYGQDWCYMSDSDTYRLGALDRDHWSSPIRFGRVFAARGTSPVNVDVCQPAIDAYRAQHPDWDKVLKDYGRPTPTIDVGE
jgi:hypothetical protein